MNLTNARATFGLNAKATPTKSGSSGTVQIGDSNESIALSDATKIISFDAVIVGTSSDLIIDISDLDNTGSTAWTAGVAQQESATGSGTISGAGNASVVVTASGMTGSPKTIAVAVAASDTAALWMVKVRAALAADADVVEKFTVGGGSTSVVLTRKPTSTYTVNGTAVNVYPANDATLNISLDNGTCTGITTAATSTNATTGVATAGAYCPDLDGNDFEGEAVGGISDGHGLFIQNKDTSECGVGVGGVIGSYLMAAPVYPGVSFQIAGTTVANFDDITIEPITAGDNSCHLTITIAGA